MLSKIPTSLRLSLSFAPSCNTALPMVPCLHLLHPCPNLRRPQLHPRPRQIGHRRHWPPLHPLRHHHLCPPWPLRLETHCSRRHQRRLLRSSLLQHLKVLPSQQRRNRPCHLAPRARLLPLTKHLQPRLRRLQNPSRPWHRRCLSSHHHRHQRRRARLLSRFRHNMPLSPPLRQ